jgi:hypothetical protein
MAIIVLLIPKTKRYFLKMYKSKAESCNFIVHYIVHIKCYKLTTSESIVSSN